MGDEQEPVSEMDRLFHDLADKLNAITIGIGLAARLTAQSGTKEAVDMAQVLERAQGDCEGCKEVLARLRAATG